MIRLLRVVALLIAFFIPSTGLAVDGVGKSFAPPAIKRDGEDTPRALTLLHFSPDGKRLAVGADGYFALLAVDTLTPVAEAGTKPGEADVVVTVVNGQLFVSVKGNQAPRDWQTGSRARVSPPKPKLQVGIASSRTMPVDRKARVVRHYSDGRAANPKGPADDLPKVLDPFVPNALTVGPERGGPLHMFIAVIPDLPPEARREEELKAYGVSPSGKVVACINKVGMLYLWDYPKGGKARIGYAGDDWETVGIEGDTRFTWLENDTVLMVDTPAGVRRFRVSTGESIEPPVDENIPAHRVVPFGTDDSQREPTLLPGRRKFVSPDGELILESASERSEVGGNSDRLEPVVRLLDGKTESRIGTLRLEGNDELVLMAWTVDAKRIAMGMKSGSVIVAEVQEVLAWGKDRATLKPGPATMALVENPVFASWRSVTERGSVDFDVTVTEQGQTTTRTIRVTLEERVANKGLRTSERDLSQPVPARDGDIPVSVSTTLTVAARVSKSQASAAHAPPGQSVEFKRVRAEKLSLAGRQIDCVLWEYKSSSGPNKSTIRYWISGDVPGMIAKYESHIEDASASRKEVRVLRAVNAAP
jgi:hypothetical protein